MAETATLDRPPVTKPVSRPRSRKPATANASALALHLDCSRTYIGKLEAEGVIQKRVAVVDPDKIGLGVSVFVAIETGDHSEEWLGKFAEAVRAMPEVLEFYRMAGDVDYMLRVAVASIQDYDAFYKKLIAAIPLKNVTSRFAMERIKQTTALPIA